MDGFDFGQAGTESVSAIQATEEFFASLAKQKLYWDVHAVLKLEEGACFHSEYRVFFPLPLTVFPSTIRFESRVQGSVSRNAHLPVGVKKGYWPTIVVWWDDFELEVFEDRIEVYPFRRDGGTDIRYGEHAPGILFSPRFSKKLEEHAT